MNEKGCWLCNMTRNEFADLIPDSVMSGVLCAEKDDSNQLVMRVCDDYEIYSYYPKFCPECGRKLRD